VSIASQLQALERIIDALIVQRDRLASEARALSRSWFPGAEMQTRADSVGALLEAVDRFVGEVVPSLEAKARAGDAAAADRAVTAAQRILQTVGGTSPTGDLFKDASEAAQGMVNDVSGAAQSWADNWRWYVGGGVLLLLLFQRAGAPRAAPRGG
jgi:hypothetical protein